MARVECAVNDNEPVKAGQPLVKLMRAIIKRRGSSEGATGLAESEAQSREWMCEDSRKHGERTSSADAQLSGSQQT